YFREAVAGMNLPADLVHDGVTMTSELAANTLHAQGNVEFSGSRQRPVSGMPELWLYLRGRGAGCELVCKVFDSGPCWGADRGLGGRLVRIDDPGGRMSVLSISRHLTLWRNQDTVSWRTPAGTYRRLQLRDLVEVAEQIICAHEQLARPSASC